MRTWIAMNYEVRVDDDDRAFFYCHKCGNGGEFNQEKPGECRCSVFTLSFCGGDEGLVPHVEAKMTKLCPLCEVNPVVEMRCGLCQECFDGECENDGVMSPGVCYECGRPLDDDEIDGCVCCQGL